MKAFVTIFGIACIIIVLLFLVGGFARGFFSVFTLLPGWVWTVIFIGCVGLYILWDEKNTKESKQAHAEQIEQLKEKRKKSEAASVLRRKQINIDHSNDVVYKSSVKIVSVNGSLITPTLNPDQTVKKDDAGNLLGTVKLVQIYKYNDERSIVNEERTSFIEGSIDALNNILQQNNLIDCSKIPGNIIRIEGINPMWEGHTPDRNKLTGEIVTVTVNGIQYPIYSKTLFTEDTNSSDRLISMQEIKHPSFNMGKDDEELPF